METMDPSVFLLLSNLLHLQNQHDPSTSLFSSSPSAASPTSSSASPLLFLTLASVLSYAASLRRSSSSSSPQSSLPLDPASRDARFRRLYSVSHPVFSSIVDLLRPFSLPLPHELSLSLTLSRLSRSSFSPARLARRHRIDPFLVSRATHAVTRILSTSVFPRFVRPPSGPRLSETLRAFRDFSSLPNVCGAIDSSPIPLSRLPPHADPSAFRSPRHSLPAAIHLQAVADHRKIFWDVCVKAAGPTDDSSHFRDSLLYHRLTSGELLLGGDGDGGGDVLTVRGHHVRPYLVGDWCYPLLSFLLTPFSSNATSTPAQNAFDAALMRARSAVEQAIGVLKARWRILQNLNVGLDHAPQTIVACCVLHNICQLAGEPEPLPFRDPVETGPLARVLESEKSFYYFGESLRQAMADDLYERQQRLSSRVITPLPRIRRFCPHFPVTTCGRKLINPICELSRIEKSITLGMKLELLGRWQTFICVIELWQGTLKWNSGCCVLSFIIMNLYYHDVLMTDLLRSRLSGTLHQWVLTSYR